MKKPLTQEVIDAVNAGEYTVTIYLSGKGERPLKEVAGVYRIEVTSEYFHLITKALTVPVANVSRSKETFYRKEE